MSPQENLRLPLERSSSAESLCPVGSAAEIHYGSGEDLERIDVTSLREAAKQIAIARSNATA